MKINLTTQTEILTIGNDDLDVEGDLYKYFNEELELEKNETKTNIKTLAYNEDRDELVLLIFDKDKEERFTQKKIVLEDV